MSIDKELLMLFSIYACKTESKAEKASYMAKILQEKAQEKIDGSVDA